MIDIFAAASEKDMADLRAAMDRARDEFGKSDKDVIQWTGIKIAQSLSASTRLGPKLRKIVRNPDERYKTDARRAPWGVFKYGKQGKYFQPIYRTGEYGRVRFRDKKTLEIKYLNKLTGKVHRADTFDQVPGLSIKTDKRRVIGRRGLAKKSWQVLQKRVKSGGTAFAMGVSDVGRVVYRAKRGEGVLTISNHLRYIETALKNGRQSLDTVIARAARNMQEGMTRSVERKLKKAGLK